MKNAKTKIIVIYLIIFFGALFSARISLAAILLQDNFEYAVERGDLTTAGQTYAHGFTENGSWNAVKANNGGELGARALFYTATSIPGFSGSFPGQNSNRVMCQEYVPAGGQTDAYLFYGNNTTGTIPANVWFQFWLYFPRFGSQMTDFTEGKWLYPCNEPGGGTCSYGGLDWLFVFQRNNSFSTFDDTSDTIGTFYPLNDSPNATMNYSGPGASWKPGLMGYNLNEGHGRFDANKWVLVKLHFDTRNSNGGWEMWKKEAGGSFFKIAEYMGGVTPGFTFNPITPNGSMWLKFMTTMVGPTSWWYYDDFVMATSEADLPIYADTDTIPPAAPTGLAVI